MQQSLVAAVFGLLVSTSAFCAHSKEGPTYDVPSLTRTPVPDGIIRSYEYRGAMTFQGVGRPKAVDAAASECALTWNEDYLFVAIRTATGPNGQLKTGKGKHSLCYDDSVELWFNPPAEMRELPFSKFGAFQIIANSKGALEGHHHDPGFGLAARELKLEGIKVGSCVHGDFWDLELAIPAAVLGCKKFRESDWGMLFARTFRSTGRDVQKSFQPYLYGHGYNNTKNHACHRLRKGGSPTPQGKAEELFKGARLPVPGNIMLRFAVNGPVTNAFRRFFTTSPLGKLGTLGMQEQKEKLQLFYHGRKNFPNNNLLLNAKPIPGEETVYSVNVSEKGVTLFIDGAMKGEVAFPEPVTEAEFGEFMVDTGDYMLRELRVQAGLRTASEIAADAQGDTGVSGSMKWYPSINAFAFDLRVAEPEFKRGMSLEVGGKSYPVTGEEAVRLEGKNAMYAVHEVVRLEDRLPDGNHVAVLKIGGEAVMTNVFLAGTRPWFNTKVGKDDILLPGFTPVKVKGATVETVGRSYVLAETGLPKEIWSLNQQILARPIELKVSGKTFVANVAKNVKVKSASETKALFKGALAAGRVEQDGLIRFMLQLPATDDATLEIPLKPEFAFLYHPISECIRVNPAGFLPKGLGKVFGSRDIPQIHIADFIPYCWIGSDDRGICFAADRAKGWYGTDKRDMIEMHREADGTVVLKLNIVSTPAPAHAVELSLMASPVKPQPEGWRGWADAYPYPCTRQMACQMSGPCWGNYSSEMGRVPPFGDFTIVRKLTETMETGEYDWNFRSNWIKRVESCDLSKWSRWLSMKDPKVRPVDLRNHVSGGFHVARQLHGRPDPTPYFYVCDSSTSAGLYDIDLMRDEWGPMVSEFGSFQDYSIYYQDKMLEAGMKGVYNDNSFFVANYDWVTGDAWIDEKGEVQPSFQLWDNREFSRREMVSQVQRGIKRPWLTVHHTNALILPTMSFASNTMGMEWKYGNNDFQERWAPDYVRAVNQGLQCGVYPTSLEGIFGWKTREERIWLTRTMMAVLLPHEVQPVAWAAHGETVIATYTKLWNFGYHESDCVYTAYWNPENPLVQREDTLVSVYRRGKRLLAVIGGYADGDIELELRPKVGKVVSAKNFETDVAVTVRGGVAILPLKRHDFALIELMLDR